MLTPREELRALVDKLDDNEVEIWLMQIRDDVTQRENYDPQKWRAEIKKLREECHAKYGEFQSAADMISEMNEERIDEIIEAIHGSPNSGEAKESE